MEITEVRVKLMDDPHDRLQAFCSITFDHSFVVRDLKIIQGGKGSFVAMPSRKLTDRCPRCNAKNHLRAQNCNQCGIRLNEDRATKDGDGRAKLYADIAHPINSACRDLIQRRVLEAYEQELVLAKRPGYRCSYDDYGEDRIASLDESEIETAGRENTYRHDGETRRIEPAAKSSPPPPHEESPTTDDNRSRVYADAVQEHERFGEGLI